MFLIYILIIPVTILIGLVLGRISLPIGLFLLVIGLLPMATLYIYETTLSTPQDTSEFGMLATILFVLAVPTGIILTIIGALK